MKPTGNENDIAVSTRIRLARNIKGLSYPSRMSGDAAKKLIEDVWSAFDNSPLKDSLALYSMDSLSENEKKSLIEKHLISNALAQSRIPSVAIISKDEKISIMVNEEDHIRLQVFEEGLCAEKAYDTAKKLEALLSEKLTFDYDEDFGYLTSCPTNAGTGLRASVMLHLPAISITENINPLLKWSSSLSMTVRGFYGEGSKASGALFQLSNQTTLGIDEKDIISRFTAAACSLISEERRISAELFEKKHNQMMNRCLRSLGILKYSYMISSDDAMTLVSDVCMGVNVGIIKNIDCTSLRKALFSAMPATVSLLCTDATAENRDIKRAEILQKGMIFNDGK